MGAAVREDRLTLTLPIIDLNIQMAGLTPYQRGVFISLLAHMQFKGEAIPEDPPRMARMCGVADVRTFKNVVKVLVRQKVLQRLQNGLWAELLGEPSSVILW